MIDRITIYIDDVKFEDVEKRLGLTPSKVAEDESLIYSSLISNLRFTYKGKPFNHNRFFAQICERKQLFFVYL